MVSKLSMKDSDTSLWLHNKLGSTDELWAPSSIASLLTNVVDNLQSSFSSLSTPVKLKLLLGMLHLPRCSTDDKKRKNESLSNVLQLATADSDDWVRTVAAILKPFPETGSLNLDLEKLNPSDLRELRKKVNTKCGSSAMLPLECKYLDKKVRETLVGPLADPVKHFNLKREPKSATLREQLLQKSKETAQQLTKIVVPFHASDRGSVRNVDPAATPVKGSGGFPKAPAHGAATTPPSVFGPPANHTAVAAARTPLQKKRGVKLLDISELRVSAGRDIKRRKTLETEAGEKDAKEENVVENITPD